MSSSLPERPGPDDVLGFWFGPEPTDPDALTARNGVWFGVDEAFDAQVRARFGRHLERAAAGALRRWKLSPRGTLALILTFDQFSRNIYRGLPDAYAHDARALALARDGVAMGIDADLAIMERAFFYMPFEHAEDPDAQAASVTNFRKLHAEAPPAWRKLTAVSLRHAEEHRELIRRFGRFPHRNLALDRASTPEEVAWLAAHRGAYGQA